MKKLLSRKLGVTLSGAIAAVTAADGLSQLIAVTVIVCVYVLGQSYVDGRQS